MSPCTIKDPIPARVDCCAEPFENDVLFWGMSLLLALDTFQAFIDKDTTHPLAIF